MRCSGRVTGRKCRAEHAHLEASGESIAKSHAVRELRAKLTKHTVPMNACEGWGLPFSSEGTWEEDYRLREEKGSTVTPVAVE